MERADGVPPPLTTTNRGESQTVYFGELLVWTLHFTQYAICFLHKKQRDTKNTNTEDYSPLVWTLSVRFEIEELLFWIWVIRQNENQHYTHTQKLGKGVSYRPAINQNTESIHSFVLRCAYFDSAQSREHWVFPRFQMSANERVAQQVTSRKFAASCANSWITRIYRLQRSEFRYCTIIRAHRTNRSNIQEISNYLQ